MKEKEMEITAKEELENHERTGNHHNGRISKTDAGGFKRILWYIRK